MKVVRKRQEFFRYKRHFFSERQKSVGPSTHSLGRRLGETRNCFSKPRSEARSWPPPFRRRSPDLSGTTGARAPRRERKAPRGGGSRASPRLRF